MYKTLRCVSGRKTITFSSILTTEIMAPISALAPLLFWLIYKLSISSKQLSHIENSIILDKKEGNDSFNTVH